MIKIIIGGIGSGKSVTAVKEIIDRNNTTFLNFPVQYKKAVRLKTDMIISSKIEKIRKDGTAIKKLSVNYDFWNTIKEDGFDIVLDEVHNIMHARMSMTKHNTLMSIWLAQIRKILGEAKHNDLILITQKMARIDVSARDLAHEIIYCSKYEGKGLIKTRLYDSRNKRYYYKMLPPIYIKKNYFQGTYCQEKFEAFSMGDECADKMTYYLANPYFQFYDSYALITFGDNTYV